MFINLIITLFNNFTLYFFRFIYKWCKIETIEDKFHKLNKYKRLMNKVKLEFNKEDEFNIVKNNILDIINSIDFLKKYNISTDSILNNTNNKFAISFKDKYKYIYIHFNHYYISGANMFILLNKMVNTVPPNFLQTNPFFGIINLPFYIYELSLLKKIEVYIEDLPAEEKLILKELILNINKIKDELKDNLIKLAASLNSDQATILSLTS